MWCLSLALLLLACVLFFVQFEQVRMPQKAPAVASRLILLLKEDVTLFYFVGSSLLLWALVNHLK